MKTIKTFAAGTLAVAVLLGLAACSGMSTRDQNTAIGAGAGAVGGAVLTGGSTVGTIGGAAVGGLIGNQIGKGDRR
jgi:osmotically inducible lipoprotein OsmB